MFNMITQVLPEVSTPLTLCGFGEVVAEPSDVRKVIFFSLGSPRGPDANSTDFTFSMVILQKALTFSVRRFLPSVLSYGLDRRYPRKLTGELMLSAERRNDPTMRAVTN